jgi:DNA-binding MarR family transcriptional regulator
MTTEPVLPDIDEVAARLRLAVARLGRHLRQQAGTGLSPSQHAVLASIDANTSLTLGELATIEQVAPPTITRIVTKLADDGLVERTVDPVDRRVTRVSVTAEGHRRMDLSRHRRNAWLARKIDDLAAGDAVRLAAALDVLEALAGPAPASAPPSSAPPAPPAAPSGASAEPQPPSSAPPAPPEAPSGASAEPQPASADPAAPPEAPSGALAKPQPASADPAAHEPSAAGSVAP